MFVQERRHSQEARQEPATLCTVSSSVEEKSTGRLEELLFKTGKEDKNG
jgi:hypothetical protein